MAAAALWGGAGGPSVAAVSRYWGDVLRSLMVMLLLSLSLFSLLLYVSKLPHNQYSIIVICEQLNTSGSAFTAVSVQWFRNMHAMSLVHCSYYYQENNLTYCCMLHMTKHLTKHGKDYCRYHNCMSKIFAAVICNFHY